MYCGSHRTGAFVSEAGDAYSSRNEESRTRAWRPCKGLKMTRGLRSAWAQRMQRREEVRRGR